MHINFPVQNVHGCVSCVRWCSLYGANRCHLNFADILITESTRSVLSIQNWNALHERMDEAPLDLCRYAAQICHKRHHVCTGIGARYVRKLNNERVSE